MTDQDTYQPQSTAAPAPLPPTTLPNEEYYRRSNPSRTQRRRKLGGVLVLIGSIWLVIQLVSGSLSHESTKNVTLIDQTLNGDRIEIDVGTANVEIQVWDQADIHVAAFQSGDDASAKESIEVQQDGSTVIIRHPPSFNLMFWEEADEISYLISVPSDTQANVHTINGTISIEGLENQLTIDTINGQVALRDIAGQLMVQTVNGEVSLTTGQLQQATITTINGDIQLDEVDGPLTLSSISGNISIKDAENSSFNVSLTSGNFDYEGQLADQSSNTAETISGDIAVELPDENNVRLNASTLTGELNNQFELRDLQQSGRSISGVMGTGSTTIKLESTSGNVSIRTD